MRHWSVQTALFFFWSLPQCIHGVFIFHILRVCHRCCPDVVYQIKALFRIQYHYGFFFFFFSLLCSSSSCVFVFRCFLCPFYKPCATHSLLSCVCVVSGKDLWFPCVWCATWFQIIVRTNSFLYTFSFLVIYFVRDQKHWRLFIQLEQIKCSVKCL